MDKAQAQPLEACKKAYYSYYKNLKLFTATDDFPVDFHPLCHAANGDLSPDGDDIVITNEDDPSKNVFFKTVHLSCKSDTYCGSNNNYAGIILYKYNEKTDWRTENDTHCMSGYVVIQDTDSAAVEKWKSTTRGVVHGAVYRNTFGEKVVDAEVVGEGFSIQSGSFEVHSGVFNNPTGSKYHHGDKEMCEVVAYCMGKLVNNWKDAGPNSLGNRNFTVKELAKGFGGNCICGVQ